MRRFHRAVWRDTVAVAALILLWLLFFWRLFTPVLADQVSLTQGDFSGQFVAFGGYQYARFSAGEVPLWNPYNNGGLPFIADTQAAVFYPPRLLTIALSSLSGTGWTYHALQLEMTFHVLAYTLAMYLFVRRLTRGQTGTVAAGLVAALVAGYGGYLTGYPPLQLALLEAGVWLPLAALGILEGTRSPNRPAWAWLVLTGFALGLSWMAGHPQTSWFLTYLLVAYFAYRVYIGRYRWWTVIAGVALFGVIAVGIVAVTLFPGLEYLLQTSRSDLGFEAKSSGFPYQDLLQILLPGVVSQWSPLYIGLSGLTLAAIGLWRGPLERWFWFAAALVALGISFGGDSALFQALYNLAPGLRFFRGQERAAYIIANSTAILAGFGAMALVQTEMPQRLPRLRFGLLAVAVLYLAAVVVIIPLWLGGASALSSIVDPLAFSVLIALLVLTLIPAIVQRPALRWLLVLLVAFELFSVNMDNNNYDLIPPGDQLQPSPLLEQIRQDADLPFRVDGFRGLTDNFGSLYAIADIQGISPLFLTGPQQIIEFGLPDERAWELFSVRYVFSDWEALPIPWELLGSDSDRRGPVNLFRLTAPRPYAHLLYDYELVGSDEAARLRLADPDFDPRTVVLLHQDPSISLPDTTPAGAGTTITQYRPESLTVIVNTPENAILSLAHVDYPGWHATLDGQPVRIIRAYGGLSALSIPAGDHTLQLVYNPLSYRIGAVVSLITWAAVILFAVILAIRKLAEKKADAD